MATIKTYEMPGCIACRLVFTLGQAQPFEAFFDGGIPDLGYPAVFVTDRIGQQLAIEHSAMFKIGKIRIAKNSKMGVRVGRPVKKEATKSVKASAGEEATKVYNEVTSVVDAVAILKGEYGVSASRLKSEASILRVADEKNVSFPNLKF